MQLVIDREEITFGKEKIQCWFPSFYPLLSNFPLGFFPTVQTKDWLAKSFEQEINVISFLKSVSGSQRKCTMENGSAENDPAGQLFDQFCHASTCKTILSTFQQLIDHVGLSHANHKNFYRKIRSRVNTWKAHALWVKLDKRANHKEYRRGEACANSKVLLIFSSTGHRPASLCHGLLSVVRPSVR